MKCRAAWPWAHNAPVPTLPRKAPQRRIDVQKLLRVPNEEIVSRMPRTNPIEKPRTVHNAASLAYLGDSVYELYVRRHFLTPPQRLDKYNACVMAVVCCEAQEALLQDLLKGKFLTQEEREVVRWGKNVVTSHSRATKRAGSAVYSRATALETLIGFLYLTNPHRLEEMMIKMGFNKGLEEEKSVVMPDLIVNLP